MIPIAQGWPGVNDFAHGKTPSVEDGDVTDFNVGLPTSTVLYNLAVGAKLPGNDPHDALEVSIQMALIDKTGLTGRSGNGYSLSQQA